MTVLGSRKISMHPPGSGHDGSGLEAVFFWGRREHPVQIPAAHARPSRPTFNSQPLTRSRAPGAPGDPKRILRICIARFERGRAGPLHMQTGLQDPINYVHPLNAPHAQYGLLIGAVLGKTVSR